MDIPTKVVSQDKNKPDCIHWLRLLPKQSQLNEQIDATREVGGEPDCIHWLDDGEACEFLVRHRDIIRTK